MARVMALRPLTRLARRLLLPQGLMRARPTMRLTRRRRRPRSIAITAGNHVVRRLPRPLPPSFAHLPQRSAPHPLQQDPQQPEQEQESSELTVSYDDHLGATRFVNLVKATLNSPGNFLTFLEIIREYRERLVREGVSADMFDTVSQVDEVLQDLPALVIAFREFFA